MKTNTEKSVTTHGNGSSSEATSGGLKKGKHDANLRKNSFINFQIGLIIALVLVYAALESSYAIFDKPEMAITEEDDYILEFYPDTENLKIEKEPKKQQKEFKKRTNPTEIEIIDDDTPKLLESLIENTESNPEDVVDLGELEYVKEIKDIEIPINVVEEVPIFPGCEKVDKSERFNCFNEKMQKHVKRYFNYPDDAIALRQQGRVSVLFKIGADGVIRDIKMRGPAKSLEGEAERIISKLPVMTPGKQQGKPVIVKYAIPINFKLE
ncbi:energy transducer TonB [Cellulophaga sp. F20128]|uniref:energy transducer TonB n=1 Tax=Cellulophaga sp. F20128 TaxID=2926413 RepID=UPI001FF5B5DE|nr:energy transducer TonB [Cellulophaga sp. F20128]MCK0155561.1 energy transducer TonB [Cellulophaga sp. F20128]